MSDIKLNFTPRENEVLVLAWQCFQTEPKYTHSSATKTLSKLRARTKQYAQNFDESNPAPLAVRGGGRKTTSKKRAAKGTENNDGEEAPKPKKRAKKAPKGAGLDGEEAKKMMGLGGGEEKKKVKDAPEDAGLGWGARDDEDEV